MPSCAAPEATSSSPRSGVAALQNDFCQSPYWSLRQIRCEWRQDRIVVHGTVTSFYMKQMAQSVAAKAVGVGRVEIDIEVEPE